MILGKRVIDPFNYLIERYEYWWAWFTTILCFVFLCYEDDEFGEKTVSVLLDGKESEMIFIDHASAEMSVSSAPAYFPANFQSNALKMKAWLSSFSKSL